MLRFLLVLVLCVTHCNTFITLHKNAYLFLKTPTATLSQDVPRPDGFIPIDIFVEKQLRYLIRYQNWTAASSIIKTLRHPTTTTSSKSTTILSRNAVYIIVETCRRTSNCHFIIPLLENLSDDHFQTAQEDDIMPFLSSDDHEDSKITNIRQALSLVDYLTNKGVIFTAKAYSTLLKKLPLAIRTSNMIPAVSENNNKGNNISVDSILSLCGSRNIVPDTILLNSAIDAYIR